jgi:uncharacterized membrane protein HdeD (DUF308 family)
MSAGVARNWWAIGLRSAAAIVFAITILSLPPQAVAPLVLLFAAYVAADGAFAILAGMRAPRWGYRWPMLILEGSVNLAAAAAVLAWQAVAAVPLVQIASAWAMITGGLLLAAAHRLSGNEGRWLLVGAGVVSAGWGALVAILGASDTQTMGLWLVGYALIFGGTLVALAGRWRRGSASRLGAPPETRDGGQSIRTLSSPGISGG